MLVITMNNSFHSVLRSRFCKQCCYRLFAHHTVTNFASSTSLQAAQKAQSTVSCSTRRKFHIYPALRSLEKRTPSTVFSNADSSHPSEWESPLELPEPALDWSFLLDKNNTELIENNIQNRKGIGDINKVISLSETLDKEQNESVKEKLRQELTMEALDIPNMSHPDAVIGDETQARVVEVVGTKKSFNFTPRNVSEIAGKGLRMLRDENLSFSSGAKTYYLEDALARMEKALVAFTVDRLLSKGFELVSVPDLLYSGVIDSCGFKTNSDRSHVYHLHPSCLHGACLAGTAEMSLAGYFLNEVIPYDQLPKRMVAVSRCYRAEAAEKSVERGLYRVHHFTKVEMFGLSSCTNGTESEELLQEILSIQRELFSALGLHFRILDMPTQELGASAQRKYDIEAWMYGKKLWGEISSCSNCTDFQSRRLNIRYVAPSGELKHVHTVNGTACAVPRLITTILEQNQEKGRKLSIPQVLWPYLGGQTCFTAELTKSSYTFIKTLRQV